MTPEELKEYEDKIRIDMQTQLLKDRALTVRQLQLIDAQLAALEPVVEEIKNRRGNQNPGNPNKK